MESGKDMDVKDIHPQNASLTMVVKDLGNKIFVNEIQFPNALNPISFNDSDKFIDVRDSHLEKA